MQNEVMLQGYEQLEAEFMLAMELADMIESGLVEVVKLANGELAFSITEEGIKASQKTDD